MPLPLPLPLPSPPPPPPDPTELAVLDHTLGPSWYRYRPALLCLTLTPPIHRYTRQTDASQRQAVTKRAGRKKDAAAAQPTSGGKPQVRKAVFESTKKKEVGVSDLTLISKISNEAINDNLKKRFENGEIYVH